MVEGAPWAHAHVRTTDHHHDSDDGYDYVFVITRLPPAISPQWIRTTLSDNMPRTMLQIKFTHKIYRMTSIKKNGQLYR